MGSTDTTAVFSCSDTDGDTITNIPTSSPYPNTSLNFIVGVVEGSLTHTNASEIFTCTRTTSSFIMGCVVAVYGGTPTSGWDVAWAGNTQNSNASATNITLTSGTTTTTTAASELAVGFFMMQNAASFTLTATGGWNLRSPNTGGTPFVLVDQVLTTTGTQQAQVIGNFTSSTVTNNNSTGGVSTIK
jgi:hypothetical protein